MTHHGRLIVGLCFVVIVFWTGTLLYVGPF
jgi:hypothetical protein